jgi:hypothetical protein
VDYYLLDNTGTGINVDYYLLDNTGTGGINVDYLIILVLVVSTSIIK